MIVGNCSSCRGHVRVPVDVNPNVSVRCPLCGEMSRLGAILEEAIPLMEIVGDYSVQVAPASRSPMIDSIDIKTESESHRAKGERFEVSPILSKGAKRRRRRGSSSRSTSDSEKQNGFRGQPSSEGAPPMVEFDSSVAQKPNLEGELRRAREQRSKRSSRKHSHGFSSSGKFEIAKVLLGAAMALPVAQMMIWWWISVDPLNLGPPVSRVIPAIVPVKFQYREADEDQGDALFRPEIERKKTDDKKDVGDLPKTEVDSSKTGSGDDDWMLE